MTTSSFLIGLAIVIAVIAFLFAAAWTAIFVMDKIIQLIKPWPPIKYNFELEDEDVG